MNSSDYDNGPTPSAPSTPLNQMIQPLRTPPRRNHVNRLNHVNNITSEPLSQYRLFPRFIGSSSGHQDQPDLDEANMILSEMEAHVNSLSTPVRDALEGIHITRRPDGQWDFNVGSVHGLMINMKF